MLRENRTRMLALASAVLSALTLGGCGEYLDRRDSISPTAGDAVRQNMATHIIDPWPRQAQNRNITLSGERAVENTSIPKEPPEPPKSRGAASVGGGGGN